MDILYTCVYIDYIVIQTQQQHKALLSVDVVFRSSTQQK